MLEMDGAGAKILAIDDERNIREMLQLGLERKGFAVRCLPDGRNVADVIDTWQPDVILLDVMMPGVDGVEIGRDLRAEPRTARIPVIAISAQADVTLRLNVQQMGADDYLSKPFEFDDMLRRVGAWAARSHELGRAVSS